MFMYTLHHLFGEILVLDHQMALGERLRDIRHQQGLTLQDVEQRSGGEWKAVVVGSYERGDRAISIAKLSRLADFYRVPLREFLPTTSAHDDDTIDVSDLPRIRLDLTRLPDQDDRDVLSALSRYAGRIQMERRDYNGRVLTIREDDLVAIAHAFDLAPADVVGRLHTAAALV